MSHVRRAFGSVESYGPLTGYQEPDMAFNNRAGPYVSHTGAVRGFKTRKGPTLAVMTGYGFAHGYTIEICQ